MKPIPPKNRMNQLESTHAMKLNILIHEGAIQDWKYEEVKFRLADKTWYTPDFFITCDDHFEIHEIKGPKIWDDALVKFKACAEKYPYFTWKMLQFTKTDGWRQIH